MTEDHDKIIHIIEAVPEKSLLLIEIAKELWVDGTPDWDKVAAKQPEINLAMAEVQSYTRSTERAIAALKEIPSR